MIKLIKTWLHDCLQLHSKCREPDLSVSAKIPARLLDVGPLENSCNNSIRLKENVRSPYIALSHCWGTTRHIVTEKANLESHKRGIPLESLPKTFQDAVELTKGIGLRHIWIDSLCIIQDDLLDWKNEAAKMADVYRNAYCTIAASGSKSDQEGVFLQRSQQDIFEMPYHAAKTHIAVTSNEDDVAAMLELHKSQLSTRAWTIQERLLSRRILHFTNTRVIWECCTRSETEDGLILGPEDFGSILTQSLFEFSTTRTKWLTLSKAVGQECRVSSLTEVRLLITNHEKGAETKLTHARHRQGLPVTWKTDLLHSETHTILLFSSLRPQLLKI